MTRLIILVNVCLLILAGCKASNPRPDQSSQQAASQWRGAVYVDSDAKTGFCYLKSDSQLLAGLTTARKFKMLSLWRFEPGTSKWAKMPFAAPDVSLPPAQKRDIYSRATDPVVVVLPAAVGLFWAKWEEDGHVTAQLISSGPVRCNDVKTGSAPAGFVAVGFPYPDHATAVFVPDPSGLEKDLALLRNTYALPKPQLKDSWFQVCEAAGRVFANFDFTGMTRQEVIGVLGDPRTVSGDYGGGPNPDDPMQYTFDTGYGGMEYVLHFSKGRVVRLEPLGLE